MTSTNRVALLVLAAVGCTKAAVVLPRLAGDAVIDAAEKAPLHESAQAGGWNEPHEPFNILGNVYYVGTAEIGSYLIATPEGHFLIDGILPQSVPQILANIRTLGFEIGEIRYLLNSHAHFDHAGGLAGLQRATRAIMVASLADKPILEAGQISFGPSAGVRFPPVRVDRVIGDGETLTLGGVTLTAQLTPGHSPGCTSWSTVVSVSPTVTRTVLFHCSATVAGQSLVPESYPGMVADFRATFAKLKQMPADVLLGNHAGFFDLHDKRARQLRGDPNAFVDPTELGRFNAELENAFLGELERQQRGSR